MEEKKKSSSVIVAVILGVLLVLLSGYVVYDKLYAKNNNKDNTNEETVEKNNDISRKKSAEIGPEQAKYIYEEYVKPIMSIDIAEKEFISLSDQFKIAYASLYTTPIDEVCNTSVETDLVKNNIIAKIGNGQVTCEDIQVYNGFNILAKIKELFGANTTVNLDSLNNKNNYIALTQYYNKNTDLVALYLTASSPDVGAPTYTYVKYTVDNNNLIINFSNQFEKKEYYDATFEVDGNNYYLKSITKVIN